MKPSLPIAAGLVILAAILAAVRWIPEEEAPALSVPGKAAMRERVIPQPQKAVAAGQDPRRAALEFLAATGDQPPGEEFERAVASWAARNPQEVLDWLAAESRTGLDGARTSALAALAWENPEDAARWLIHHPNHAGFDRWAAVIAPWCQVAPAAAHAWVSGYLETDMQEALRPVMLSTCREPSVIAALLDEGGGDGTLVDLARGSIRREPAFAQVLIERIKSDETREAARARLGHHQRGTPAHSLVQDAGAEHQEN